MISFSGKCRGLFHKSSHISSLLLYVCVVRSYDADIAEGRIGAISAAMKRGQELLILRTAFRKKVHLF